MRPIIFLLIIFNCFGNDSYAILSANNKEFGLIKALTSSNKKREAESYNPENKNQERIKQLRFLFKHPQGLSICDTISDILYKMYTLRIGKRGEVFGFHPYWMRNKYLNYNFNLISTLLFYGFELNERTGGYKTVNGWDTVAVINEAKRAGCKVELCVYLKNEKKVSVFLKNNGAQVNLATQLSTLLKEREANGVNIMFDEMEPDNCESFTKFIRLFSKRMKSTNKEFELTVTIPVLDENLNYDIKNLDPYVDHFVIDFTKAQIFGPIVPLKGSRHSLEAGISRCMNTGVAPSKFIACLPYYGALWDFQTMTFMNYIAYNKIVLDYLPNTPAVPDGQSIRLDLIGLEQDTVQQLWYDDAQMLSDKYEFVLQNDLGGIGIWALGYDNDQPELWNALMDKMLTIDTLDVKLFTIPKPTIWTGIKKELVLYKELFNSPCKFNKEGKMNDLKSDDYIGYITSALIALLLLVTLYSIAKSRTLGDDWKFRKLFLRILIAQVILVLISLLMFCFLSPSFTYFGTNSSEDCDTSFGIILIVLGIGFLIGLLAMKLLVFPLIKPKEIP